MRRGRDEAFFAEDFVVGFHCDVCVGGRGWSLRFRSEGAVNTVGRSFEVFLLSQCVEEVAFGGSSLNLGTEVRIVGGQSWTLGFRGGGREVGWGLVVHWRSGKFIANGVDFTLVICHDDVPVAVSDGILVLKLNDTLIINFNDILVVILDGILVFNFDDTQVVSFKDILVGDSDDTPAIHCDDGAGSEAWSLTWKAAIEGKTIDNGRNLLLAREFTLVLWEDVIFSKIFVLELTEICFLDLVDGKSGIWKSAIIMRNDVFGWC